MLVTRALVLGLMALSLSACAHRFGATQIPVAEGVAYDLLPPASFGRSVSLTQLAEIESSGDVQEMLFVSEITSQAISIVGLLPNGTRLFSIVYDGMTIESDGYESLLNRIQPAFFLADFQFSQWPIVQLVSQLQKSSSCFNDGNCSFRESQDRLQRTLRVGSRLALAIDYGGLPVIDNTIELTHYLRGYRINLTMLSIEQL